MLDLIRQEFYKLFQKKSVLLSPLAILALMLFMGTGGNLSDRKYFFTQGFSGFQWLDIAIVVIGANMMAMEFEYGTIKHLVASHNNKFLIYMSKMIVLTIYDVIMHFLIFIFTFSIAILVYGSKLPLHSLYNGRPIINTFITATLGDQFGTILVITLVFLIAGLSRTSSIAATGGLALLIFGTSVSSLIIKSFGSAFPFVKWNPGNMFNVGFQFATPGIIKQSFLTDSQLVIGNLVYIVLFIILGYIAFSRKRI